MNTKFSKKIGSIVFAIGLLFCTLPAWAMTATQVAKLLASDGALEDYFGFGIAINGDTALIGAYLDDDQGENSGSVYVFTRDTSGTWTQQAKLLPDDGAPSLAFGLSIALDGDTAVIGARASAYVFTRDTSGTWTQQAKLVVPGATSFSEWVALDGDTALIGREAGTGSVYVFTRDAGGNWTQQAELLAADGALFDRFGWSVSLDCDTALIGAYRNAITGSAYVFTRDAGGNWTQQAKLVPDDGAQGDHFGISVSLNGDTALIGSEANDDVGRDSGSAYVFARDAGGNWTQQAKLVPDDLAAYDEFGYSVSISGDTALIGSIEDTDNGIGSGSAYVFARDTSGTWTQQAKLVPDDGAVGEEFGISVRINGDTALIGADCGWWGSSQGSAYVFSLTTPDSEGPITYNLVASPNPAPLFTSGDYTAVTVTTEVDDSTTGGSNIDLAEYSLDGGITWYIMDSVDGAFDETTEAVIDTLSLLDIGILQAGVYNVCVRGTDVHGNTGPEECLFLVVYDPDGGSVTGGGWLDSPMGAYAPDPDLSGKANFGFVSKYKKGVDTPTGQTEFQFKVANVNFHSSNYDWLVVAGPKAMYKGTGTINGEGNYGFMLSAIDEDLTPSTDVDLFRIKIWDKDNADALVYDNQIGCGDEAEDAEPCTAIGGGSIVIHKGK